MAALACIGHWHGHTPTAELACEDVVSVSTPSGNHTVCVWLPSNWSRADVLTTECHMCVGCRAMFVAPSILFVRSGGSAALVSFWIGATPSPMPPLFDAAMRGDDAAAAVHRDGDAWAPTGFGPLVHAGHIAALMGSLATQHLLCERRLINTSWIEKCPWYSAQQRHLHELWNTCTADKAVAYARQHPDAATDVSRWYFQGHFNPLSPAQMHELAVAVRWGTRSSTQAVKALPRNVRHYYRRRPVPHAAAIRMLLLAGLRGPLPPEMWGVIASFVI